MIVSTLLIVVIGTFVTNKIVEPRLGKFEPEEHHGADALTRLSPRESKGLKAGGIVLLLLILGIIIACIPQNSLLRNPETGSLTTGAPLIDGLIVLLALIFLSRLSSMAGLQERTRARATLPVSWKRTWRPWEAISH